MFQFNIHVYRIACNVIFYLFRSNSITSLTQSDTSPSDQLEIGRSNQTAVSAVKEIINSPNKESTVVKEYLSYISPAPVFKQEPLPSTSPAETIPASAPEELETPPTKL